MTEQEKDVEIERLNWELAHQTALATNAENFNSVLRIRIAELENALRTILTYDRWLNHAARESMELLAKGQRSGSCQTDRDRDSMEPG